MALNAGTMEAIDRCPKHIPPGTVEGDFQLVGEGCLPGGVGPVDRHTSRMRSINRVDQSDKAANQPGAIKLFCGRHRPRVYEQSAPRKGP